MAKLTYGHYARALPPVTYIEPTVAEVKEAVSASGIPGAPVRMIQDLANMAAGGSFQDKESIASRLGYDRWGSSYWERRMRRNLTSLYQELDAFSDFAGGLDFENLPGSTPIQKAIAAYKGAARAAGVSPDDGLEGLQSHGQRTADRLNKAAAYAMQLPEDIRDLLGFENLSYENLFVEMTDKNLQLILDVARRLDKMPTLKPKRRATPVPRADGSDVRNVTNKDLHEVLYSDRHWPLYKAQKTEWLLQALSRSLTVRERIVWEDKRQLLFLLIDCSASMRGSKHRKAVGVALHRMRAVVDGSAEIHLALYDTRIQEILSATTPAEAKALIQWLQNAPFHGGSTATGQCVVHVLNWMKQRCESNPALVEPDLLVCTDEDGSVSHIPQDLLAGRTIHGIAVESTNSYLREVSQRTGGIYIENL